MKKYKIKKKKNKKYIYILIPIIISICVITLGIGYSKYSTILTINGNVDGSIIILKNKVVSSGNGLIKDGNEYYFYGKNVDNYIKLMDVNGNADSVLWRIIGIDENGIKLIRNDSIGSYAWDTKSKSDWGASSLNQYLNTTYINSLSSINMEQLVRNPIWNIGKSTNGVSLVSNIEYIGGSSMYSTVGLVNILDYVKTGGISNSWLRTNYNFWSITTRQNRNTAFLINSIIYYNTRKTNTKLNVRPVIYITENVYINGNGTYDNPYKVVAIKK